MKTQISLTAIAVATAMTATAAQADDIKVSGKVFYEYATITETAKADKTGGNITRTYLTAKKKINDTWSAKVTFDSALDSTLAAAGSKANSVFLKTAQLTGHFSDALNVKLGMIGTPWIGYEDKLNGHRHIAKSFVDTQKMDSSADAGIGIFGKAGMVSYDIVSVNGGGYGNTTATEKTDLNARIGIAPIDGLTVDFGYRDGYLGKFAKGVTENKNTLTQVLVTYGRESGDLSYRVGANMISHKVEDQLPAGAATKTEKGQELWVWARSGEFGGYIRSENLDFDVAGKNKETRLVVSLDYYAAKDTIFSLVSDKITDLKGATGVEKSTTGLFTQFKF